MSDRAAYSRTYWTVMSDEKFDGIRENVKHFGSWSLLLIVADMAWPAPAYVPPTVPRASYKSLVDAGLIDDLTGGRFRVHGLDAERSKRRDAATRTPPRRPPTGPQLGPKRDPNGEQDERETRRDETRRDETGVRAPTAADDTDALDTYYALTLYRPWGLWSGDAILGAIKDYGDDTVSKAMQAEYQLDRERKTLLARTQARLARDAERARRDAAERPRREKPKHDPAKRAELLRQFQVLDEESA